MLSLIFLCIATLHPSDCNKSKNKIAKVLTTKSVHTAFQLSDHFKIGRILYIRQ